VLRATAPAARRRGRRGSGRVRNPRCSAAGPGRNPRPRRWCPRRRCGRPRVPARRWRRAVGEVAGADPHCATGLQGEGAAAGFQGGEHPPHTHQGEDHTDGDHPHLRSKTINVLDGGPGPVGAVQHTAPTGPSRTPATPAPSSNSANSTPTVAAAGAATGGGCRTRAQRAVRGAIPQGAGGRPSAVGGQSPVLVTPNIRTRRSMS